MTEQPVPPPPEVESHDTEVDPIFEDEDEE